MVCGDVTLGLGVIFKHGEVHHPQWTPALCKETIFTAKLALAQLDTQRTHRIVNDLGLVRTKENQITILRTGALDELGQRLFADIFHDGEIRRAHVCTPVTWPSPL